MTKVVNIEEVKSVYPGDRQTELGDQYTMTVGEMMETMRRIRAIQEENSELKKLKTVNNWNLWWAHYWPVVAFAFASFLAIVTSK